MRLMGLKWSEVRTPGVGEKAIGRMLGNSMSVNVLERILARVLLAAGCVRQWDDLSHGWETLEAAERRVAQLKA